MSAATTAMKFGLRTGIILLLAAALLALQPGESCEAAGECPEPAAYGRQRFPSELIPYFDGAGFERLGAEMPRLPKMLTGYPNAKYAAPYIPCIILKTVGYTESGGWRQFRAAYDLYGDTVISFDFGYGIMQITSGMSSCIPPASFERSLVASWSKYNIATGALFLANKWNALPYIGLNDPHVVEDWYYAVWGYNGWSMTNNPAYECPIDDPECQSGMNNANRPPFDGTQPRGWYPYQELVWGFAAHPPLMMGTPPAWTAAPLTLPDKSLFAPDKMPEPTSQLAQPLPYHGSCSITFIPLVISNPDGAPIIQ